MIGIDTNVPVHYLVQDDPKQPALATRFFESPSHAAPAYVPQVVLAETVRVLRSRHAADAPRIGQAIETLLRKEVIMVERADVVWRALGRFRQHQGGSLMRGLPNSRVRPGAKPFARSTRRPPGGRA